MFENPRRGRQAKNFTTNVPKILDLESSSKQIFSKNCRWVPLTEAIPMNHASTGYAFKNPKPSTININYIFFNIILKVKKAKTIMKRKANGTLAVKLDQINKRFLLF